MFLDNERILEHVCYKADSLAILPNLILKKVSCQKKSQL